MINSVRSDKGPTTRKKCFFVTCVTSAGMQTACFPPSIQSLQRYGNVHCVPLLAPYPAVPFNSSASPLPFFTLTLTKHHHGKKKSKPKSKKNQKKPKKTWTFAGATYSIQPSIYGDGNDISRGKALEPYHSQSRPHYHPLSLSWTYFDPTPAYALITRGRV